MGISQIHQAAPPHMIQYHPPAPTPFYAERRRVWLERMSKKREGEKVTWYRHPSDRLVLDLVDLMTHPCKAYEHNPGNDLTDLVKASKAEIKGYDDTVVGRIYPTFTDYSAYRAARHMLLESMALNAVDRGQYACVQFA